MTILAATYEGQSNAVMTAPNSDDFGDTIVSAVTTGNVAYDNTHVMHGTQALKYAAASGTQAYFRWSGFSSTSIACRAYVYMTALPTADCSLPFYIAKATSTRQIHLHFTSGGNLRLSDNSSPSANTWTAAATFPLNQWVRVELYATGQSLTAGTITAAYYLGDSLTPVDSFTSSTLNVDTTPYDTVRVGKSGTDIYATAFWVDDVKVDTAATGLIGPATAVTLSYSVLEDVGLTEWGLFHEDFYDTTTETAGLTDSFSYVLTVSQPVITKISDFTFAVEAAMGSTPRTVTPTWTDISQYVRLADGVTFQRGRSNVQDALAQPGRAAFSLLNDGRFTVDNPSSPYAPVQLRRPVRCRVTYGGVTFPRWSGFVDTWGNGLDQTLGIAQVTASDRLARAGKNVLPNFLIAEYLADAPVAFYPLSEDSQATTAGDRSGNAGVSTLAVAQIGTGGTIEFGSGNAPGTDGGGSVKFTPANIGNGKVLRMARPLKVMQVYGGLSGECDVLPSAVQFMGAARWWSVSEDLSYIELGTGSGPQVGRVTLGRADGTIVGIVGTTVIPTDSWTHLAFTISTDIYGLVSTLTLFVNGVAEATVDFDTRPNGSPFGGYECSRITVGGGANGALWSGNVANVTVYDHVIGSDRILEHANARTGWAGETTGARFSRICRVAGTPSSGYYTLGAGLSTMSGQPTEGVAFLDALRAVGEAENGVVYVDWASTLIFAPRNLRYNAPVAVVLDATASGHVAQGTTFTTDDSMLLNDETVTRPGGAVQRVVDAASVNAYDAVVRTRELYLNDDDQALSAAQWTVFTNSTPVPRVDAVTVDILAYANSGGSVSALLGATIGTRIQVSNLPSIVSGTAALDLFIEGVTDTISADQWLITFATSAVGAAGGVWTIEDPVLGRLDTGGVLAY